VAYFGSTRIDQILASARSAPAASAKIRHQKGDKVSFLGWHLLLF
jgi:hypothetical protein